MTWNYRIIKRKHHLTGEVYYALNEVFYSDEGLLKAYSDSDEIIGESPSEIIEVVRMMYADVKRYTQVLTEEDFGNET